MYSIIKGDDLNQREFAVHEQVLHQTISALLRSAKRILSDRSPCFTIVSKVEGRGGFWDGNGMTIPIRISKDSKLPRFLNRFFSSFATRAVHELGHGLLGYKSENRLPANFRDVCASIKADFAALAPFECAEITQVLSNGDTAQITALAFFDRPPQMQLGILAYTLLAREYYTAFGYGKWGPFNSEFRMMKSLLVICLPYLFATGENSANIPHRSEN